MDKDQILVELISQYNGGMTHRGILGFLSNMENFFTTEDKKKELSNRLGKLKNKGVLTNQEYPKGDGVWYWLIPGSDSVASEHIEIPEDNGTKNYEEIIMEQEVNVSGSEENALPYGIVEQTRTVYVTVSGVEYETIDEAIIASKKYCKLQIINEFLNTYELQIRGLTTDQIILKWEEWIELRESDDANQEGLNGLLR